MEGRDGHILYAWRAEIPFIRPSGPDPLEGGGSDHLGQDHWEVTFQRCQSFSLSPR